jgi:WD40 repeat protein
MSTRSAVPGIWTLTGHTRDVYACAISPDSSFVVSASEDKTPKIWDAPDRRPWWAFWRRR